MKVIQSGQLFSFYFEARADVIAFNNWMFEIGQPQGCVQLPFGVSDRKLRRILTKSPSILSAVNADSETQIRERWAAFI